MPEPIVPNAIPDKMSITLATKDLAVIHGVLAADARQILEKTNIPEYLEHAENLARIAREVDHQVRTALRQDEGGLLCSSADCRTRTIQPGEAHVKWITRNDNGDVTKRGWVHLSCLVNSAS